jgi:hypothetical protein
VWTDDGLVVARDAPGIENLPNPGEHAFEIGRLLIEECPDVDARRGAGASEPDDVLDLGEREPEAAGLTHEAEESQHVRWISTVPGGCPAGPRKDAAHFVQSKRLAAHAAARGNLPDEELLFHGGSIRLAPWGKVKSLRDQGVNS